VIKPNAGAGFGGPTVLLSAGGYGGDVDLAPNGSGYAAITTFGTGRASTCSGSV
jgi:hypothetical protein